MSNDQLDSRSSRYREVSHCRIAPCLGAPSAATQARPERRGFDLRGALTIAITAALAVASSGSLQAGSDPSEVELSALDGTNGFAINGEVANDRLGQ